MKRITVSSGHISTGGGLSIYQGEVLVEDSTFADNKALGVEGRGGAIEVTLGSHLEVRNSTLMNNDARLGGAIFVDDTPTLDLVHATLAGNIGATGTGIYVAGAANLIGSLVEGTCGGAGTITSFGGNLESPGATCGLVSLGDQQNVADAMLSALGDWGGPTATAPPLPGSPARDAIDGCPVAADQRDAPRPVDGGGGLYCDIGAVESASPVGGVLFGDGFETGFLCAWQPTFALPEDGNGTEATATPLPAIDDCDQTQTFEGIVGDLDDLDLFVLQIADDPLCAMDPRLILSGQPAMETCMWVQCVTGTAVLSQCPPGSVPVTSLEGRPGCCGTGSSLSLDFSCAGSFADDASVWIQVGTGAPGCFAYSGEFSG